MDAVEILDRVVQEYLTGKVVFEQRPGGSEGASHEDTWGECLANTKALWQESVWLVGTGKEGSVAIEE